MKLTEPPRNPPRPGSIATEVVDLSIEIMSRHPMVTLAVARAYARDIVVVGRLALEDIRVHGRIQR